MIVTFLESERAQEEKVSQTDKYLDILSSNISVCTFVSRVDIYCEGRQERK